jgi:hypothetical protein
MIASAAEGETNVNYGPVSLDAAPQESTPADVELATLKERVHELEKTLGEVREVADEALRIAKRAKRLAFH